MVTKEKFNQLDKNGLLVRAPAKLNLSLLIAGKRPDGYHEIETVMSKIDFYDELIFKPADRGIELEVSGPEWAPEGEDNLVYRAAEILLKSRNISGGIRIELIKNIPAGTGLGSASSDAVAALLGVDKLLRLGASKNELNEIAASLGSDLNFFLGGQMAFCEGRGEKIREIPENFPFTANLIIPNISSSTPEVYKNYKHNVSVYDELKGKIGALIHKKRFDLITKMCANMLQASCFEVYGELSELKDALESLDIGPICLSGSGSAMYCLAENETKARSNLQKISDSVGCRCMIVRSNGW